MLPMVVAGGLLIALSLCFGLNAAEQAGSLPAILKQIGAAAFYAYGSNVIWLYRLLDC